ncbi:tetratricopeptide repeat protein [Caenimonas aquaedulcis]|uniref:Tetratricopeptide repeat protein n=1 Tax=Caenimonas aquaedulcis TaxID=2793270 RepID=A0A931H7D0_9BURK|nr:tetratricopeptide repeat protein [Caenimonas aquaedulcis]MBG9389893.1 tetratricopeptide repeat protein [Caenimonas aquaedulcis]
MSNILSGLWDYAKPAVSEGRFRAAMAGASSDDVLILQTQIARTYGLRHDFAKARELLQSIELQVASASPEAKVRWHLEMGRTYASPAHAAESQSPEAREAARLHYLRAFELAKQARIDVLAVDALHMMPMVDTEPAAQLDWDLKAIAYMEQSDQPDAKGWEAALRNNVGHAKRLQGDYEEALRQFRLSLAAHERKGNAYAVRVAHWMIARTYRDQKKFDDAIAIQLRLEQEWAAAGEPDPYVFEELEQLYAATGDTARARLYGERLRAARAAPQ